MGQALERIPLTRKVGRIRDVARETGLSTATISRVMNGAGNVTADTRARVLDACSRLNYLPNPAARALSTRKSRTIAAIIPSIEHSIYAKFISAIEKRLALRGYSLVLAVSNGSETDELAAARKLLGMGAEALILSGAAHSSELNDLLARRGVPHAFTSVWDPESSVPTIGYDNETLARDAIRFIAGKGHKKIAVVHGPTAESDRTRARTTGAEAGRSDKTVVDVFECRLDVPGGKAAANRVLRAGTDYTAIFCFSDILALGVYFALIERGITIPDAMSVMGFDNLDWTGAVVPGLTTINIPATKMGFDVADQLILHLEDGEPVAPTKVDGWIVERGSVVEPPGS
ncbi:MAG: LacI family DNA-binding transcriptional regulator [Pseudomonadota bacterium]